PNDQAATPQVKCDSSADLTDTCDLSGWTFHVTSGSLVSDPKTIWVQVPQTSSATQWTLLARSDWTLTPATAVVNVVPIGFPATDPGHYAGTIGWSASGSQLLLPVEAIVTAGNVALYEPSRILLPDG